MQHSSKDTTQNLASFAQPLKPNKSSAKEQDNGEKLRSLMISLRRRNWLHIADPKFQETQLSHLEPDATQLEKENRKLRDELKRKQEAIEGYELELAQAGSKDQGAARGETIRCLKEKIEACDKEIELHLSRGP